MLESLSFSYFKSWSTLLGAFAGVVFVDYLPELQEYVDTCNEPSAARPSRGAYATPDQLHRLLVEVCGDFQLQWSLAGHEEVEHCQSGLDGIQLRRCHDPPLA